MNTKLDMIIGPMYSGKSFELIRRIRLVKVINEEFLVVKPIIDKRYSDKNVISTHNYDQEDCVCVSRIDEIFEFDNFVNTKHVFIDEGQFFPDLKDSVMKLLEEYNKNVVLTGLDGDFKREPFGEILDLIPKCNTCIKKNALCKICKDGTKAIFSHRMSKCDNNQILVGSDKLYQSVCRKHYIELNK